jgi:acyl-coenzyme A synthetase/AMP-(fatty) acid ligase
MGLAQHGANLGVISLAHSYGFSNLVLPLLLHGMPLILAESALPAAVDAALAAAQRLGGGAILPAVPAMWKAWSQAGIVDAERVHLAISAGAPLPIDLEKIIYAETHLKIHNFLGSSECGGIAYDRSESPRGDGQEVGHALDGVSLSITASGVLAVESAAVATAYWPIDDPATLGGGRFVTADLAQLDAARGVRLLGRAGDSINVAGRKVSPVEIETVLAAVDGVDHCVVFGVPTADAQRVEDIVACVSGPAPEAALRAALLGALPAWMLPRRWWRCDDLRPNARGKISRLEWRERFLRR